MSKPKAPKESAEARAARMAEEERIRVMTQRADAEEAAAGRSLLTRRTRMVMRLFGARRAIAGVGAGGALGAILGGGGSLGFSGNGSGSLPLGYGGYGGGGGGGLGGGNTVLF